MINPLKTVKQGIVVVPCQHATYQPKEGKDAFGDYGVGAYLKRKMTFCRGGFNSLSPLLVTGLCVSYDAQNSLLNLADADDAYGGTAPPTKN